MYIDLLRVASSTPAGTGVAVLLLWLQCLSLRRYRIIALDLDLVLLIQYSLKAVQQAVLMDILGYYNKRKLAVHVVQIYVHSNNMVPLHRGYSCTGAYM